jgi:hypothetical protein
MGTRSALTLAAVQQLFQEQTQTMMDEIKSLRDEGPNSKQYVKRLQTLRMCPMFKLLLMWFETL